MRKIITRIELNTQPNYYVTVASIEDHQLHLIISTDCVCTCMYVFKNIIIGYYCSTMPAMPAILSLSTPLCVLTFTFNSIYLNLAMEGLPVSRSSWWPPVLRPHARVCV